MMIRNMFAEDINRQINGVIKVDQDTTDVIEQEVREYVITKELKKHFISFFDYYSDSFDKPTDDIGVWISGFFGSGKSHFLKMLSYILENKSVGGVPTVEMFRKKFADDPATFMLIDKATRGKTETILFNIDIEGSINKDKTAVLRVFAKMFYNHLGFFGENLKVAMLEQYIDQLGKTEEFRRVFEAKKGKSWVDQRKAFAFNGKFIIPTLMEVLDMSEEDAKRWFNDKTAVEFSIAQLVEDIKAYVKKQPKDFRLIFLIDEVGQYVGTDTDMLLNLQSLTEKIGSECGGKVWVMCTGQEAIDEIIKVRADEFSRIQARFKTRLSLSSSSVDEVMGIVYIYHDKVDEASHTSDSAVFPACDDAIAEIKNLIRIIVNEFGGTNVIVTADHGFLYTYSPLSEDDKVDKTSPSDQDVEIDRRYLITKKGTKPDYLLPIRFMDGQTEYDAFAPRENVRIKKKGGGLNFVHGGISLQEMVVPVLEFQFMRNAYKMYQRNKDKIDTKPVTISLLSANRKISNMIFSLNFYQKEAVGGNREAATYLLYFVDVNGQKISDTSKIIADKASDNAQERTFRCNFNLRSQKYSNRETYYLIIADESGLQAPIREEFQIDIAFAVDEFNFF